jgi:hypothetical protein
VAVVGDGRYTSIDPKTVVPSRSTNLVAPTPGFHAKVTADPGSRLPGAGVVKEGVDKVDAGAYLQRSFK